MANRIPQLIFYSKNYYTAEYFQELIELKKLEEKKEFRFKLFRKLVSGVEKIPKFESIYELYDIVLDFEYKDLINTSIIFDLYSFDISQINNDDIANLKNLILEFPEIKFSFLTFSDNIKYLKRIFDIKNDNHFNEKNIEFNIDFGFHIAKIESIENDISLLIKGKNNLFDFSNLRSFIICSKLSDLKYNTFNYFNTLVSKTRFNALCIDEEVSQTIFNCFTLYKYGIRSIPIINFTEFKWFFEEKKDYYVEVSDKGKGRIDFILRDYDIQFDDILKDYEDSLYNLRGVKKIGNKWVMIEKYWDIFKNSFVIFITRLKSDRDNTKPYINNKLFKQKCINPGYSLDNDNEEVILRGISKPIKGYFSIKNLIKKNYDTFVIDSGKIDYSRKNNADGHSIHPKILLIAERMLKRAEYYYNKNEFILSAVITQIILEYTNALQLSISLKALELKILSEINIEVNYLGIGNVKKSSVILLEQFETEASRYLKDSPDSLRNYLSSIFINIRNIYKEKEQFEAADEALSCYIKTNYNIRNQLINNILKIFQQY